MGFEVAMKQNYWITSIYVFGLCFSTAIVSLDTFLYYETHAQASVAEQPVTGLGEELVKQEPSPTPTPTTKPSGSLQYSIRSFTKIETADQNRITAAQSSFLHSTHATSITTIDVYDLQYDIQGKTGSWQPVSAKVYIPTQPGNYPLFVFGSGTTGIADKCAPSLENVSIENLGNYHNHMITQAAEGYITVFPNYEGFNSPEYTQAYFISESEAKTVLAAIHSLYELQSTKPYGIDFSKVFLSGYSQGGHAALSASKMWQELPKSINLVGIIEFAGASDVRALFIESPWLAPYLVQSFTEYYGSNLQAFQVLQDQWLQKMQENNEALCVNAAYKFYPRDSMYTPQFKDAIDSDTWPDVLANWHQVIESNTPLTEIPDVPHLSVQGATDPIVTAQTQVKNVQSLCDQGHAVGYKEYPGVNHFDIRKAGFDFSNKWMKEVISGNEVFSSCRNSLTQ
jgi:acetyl esterase/lipase